MTAAGAEKSEWGAAFLRRLDRSLEDSDRRRQARRPAPLKSRVL